MKYYKDELRHYGVIGMKWGVRRYQPYSIKPRGSGKTGREIGEAAKYVVRRAGSTVSTTTRKVGSAVSNTTRKVGRAVSEPVKNKINKKREEARIERDKVNAIKDRQKAIEDIRLLSDSEIKERINRIKNEQELKRLTTQDIEPGRKFVNDIFNDSSKKVLTTALTGAALYGVKYLVDNEFDKSDFARSVYRGGAPKK